MKRFFQGADTIVEQAINGVLRTSAEGSLARAEGHPHTKFMVRGDWDKRQVAIISGGGAGHEPGHIGFVGQGMLTAAVSGDVFVSPSVEAILSCILTVTGDPGCLLIVKNYTGDRLNFGLAAERAKEMGKRVEMVIVGDDIALPDSPQPRGIAGTLFVHKMAGYLSDLGRPLDEIARAAEDVARTSFSLGFALSSCTPPGQNRPDPIDDPELGLGIHGEPGVEKIQLEDGSQAVTVVLDRISKVIDADSNYALLINNLGSVTPLEMSIITDQILCSDFGNRVRYVIGPEAMMTSLNMYGFSLSVVQLTTELASALAAPVAMRAWPQAVVPSQPRLIDIGHLQLQQKFTHSESQIARKLLTEACDLLIESEADLNALDARVGDGDTGSTFANAARAVQQAMDTLPLAEPGPLLLALGQTLSSAMGGSSGVLNSIMLTRAGTVVNEGGDWASGLAAGLDKMMSYGGATLGDRTMLDALIPAIDRLKERDFSGAAQAARQGANNTASMQAAKAGRSSYLNADSLDGVIDPGAEAIARLFERLMGPTLHTNR